MRGLEAVAERAARERCARILSKVEAAIANHAPDAETGIAGNEVRARARGLIRLWISQPGLRFARRMMP